MSRYAAARDGEKLLYPGNFTGYVGVQVLDPRLLRQARWAEDMRRYVAATARHLAVDRYNAARDESLRGPSYRWMRPHGRPRFRWVERTLGDGPTLLEVTCVVYPEGALP